MLSKEQDIALQPKMALDDLLTRCTDYDDMSLSMDTGELTALKQHISLLESSAVAELLSLREQYKSQSNELTAMTAAAQALRDEMYKCDAKLDALKSLPRHVFSVLVNELRDVPAVGCKRELIVGVLNRHGVSAEMCEPQAAE
ncbi:hypothetical protein [Yersinia pseudotuberculosis]